MLTSMTYLSTATSAFSEDDLVELLEVSRRNNHAAGLSGRLLYAGGHFIQTLEGPPDAVTQTYARIEADQRHRDIIVALDEPIDERLFGDWSMGFEQVAAATAPDVPGFNAFLATQGEQELDRSADLGRAGVFHRVFRDRMR